MPNSALPPDDLSRALAFTDVETPESPHLGIAGDTYTILVTGKQTAGQFCVIDMYVPPGGGPPPHRHSFEETFSVVEGEVSVTFRGRQMTVRAGQTVNIPANAPHQFRNVSSQPARMICICAPAGQEEFFREIGDPVASRTTPPPKPGEEQMAETRSKVEALAVKYKTEMLDHA